MQTLYEGIQVTNMRPSHAMSLNQSLMQTPVAAFRCPSDVGPPVQDPSLSPGYAIAKNPGASNFGLPVSNYLASNNTTSVRQSGASNMRNGTTGAVGMFYKNSDLKMRDITDGTSNTFMVGERAYELGGVRHNAGTLLATRDYSTNGPAAQDVGGGWNQGLVTVASATRYPINPPLTAPNSGLQNAYSSQHPGGAQFVYADGSVHFVAESIALNMVSPYNINSPLETLAGIRDGQTFSTP